MKNWRKNIFCLTVLLFVLLFYSNNGLPSYTIFQEVGIASSPNPVGSGARAMGMGGAFIGIADDATSASWNPAGLIQLERPEISIVGAYLNSRDSFSSATHPEINDTGKMDDLNINYFSATYPFQFYRNIVVSINYQRLYEFNRNFSYQYDFPPEEDAKLLETMHFNQKGYIGALGLAFAIEIIPTLSFGTSLNIWTDKLLWKNEWEETVTNHRIYMVEGITYIIDTLYNEKYSEFSGTNANLGLLWDLNQYITLGIVVKWPFRASIHHELNFWQTYQSGTSNQDHIEEGVKLKMPLSYGGGLAWRVSDALSFDLDIYRTKWSDYILIDSQGNKFSPIDGQLDSSSKVKNTTQVRFGGEYLFISKKNRLVVPLRAGIFYDPEPSYNEVKRFYGASIGSGFAYKGIIFDVAYQLRWGRNVDTGNLIPTSRADIMQHLLLTSLIIHF